MIAEPYICIKGPRGGELQWFNSIDPRYVDSAGEYHHEGVTWRVYADFEREKLKGLGTRSFYVDAGEGYFWHRAMPNGWGSRKLIGYSGYDYANDSESSRLLRRAEFLKAVCEKEGVEWVAKGSLQNVSACRCGDPRRKGAHRTDGPCFLPIIEQDDGKEDRRDYYTKAEIDEKFRRLYRTLEYDAWRPL